jgi:hypothetical protein
MSESLSQAGRADFGGALNFSVDAAGRLAVGAADFGAGIQRFTTTRERPSDDDQAAKRTRQDRPISCAGSEPVG